MKTIIAFTITSLLSISIHAQRHIKKFTVHERGSIANVTYTPINEVVTKDEVSYKITPISPDELNSYFVAENILNGKFDYSHYKENRNSYFIKKRRRKRIKSNYSFFLEGAEWLLDKEKINHDEYLSLINQIVEQYEKNSLKGTESKVFANPYFIDGRYLNVFQIEFTNPTDKTLLFDHDIIISTATQTLSPMTSNDIVIELNRNGLMNTKKSFSLLRHNLKDIEILPANSTVIKYFSTIPLSTMDDTVSISILGIHKPLIWERNVNRTDIDETYIYYELELEWGYSTGFSTVYTNDGKRFSLIKCEPFSGFLINNELYIEEDNVNSNFEIFTLSIKGNNIYYGRISNIKGNEFLMMEKSKRKTITLELDIIESLEKKTK